MIKEIPLRGIATTPDEYLSQDGDLSIANNVISHAGSLRTMPEINQIKTLPAGERLLYIHKNHSYENYILLKAGQIISRDNTSTTPTDQALITTTTYKQITSIGDILTITDATGMHHCVFRDGQYNVLPVSLPDYRNQFALLSTMKSKVYASDILTSTNKKYSRYKDLAYAYDFYHAFYWGTDTDEQAKTNNMLITGSLLGSLGAGDYRIHVISNITGTFKVWLRGYAAGAPAGTYLFEQEIITDKQGGDQYAYFTTPQACDHFGVTIGVHDGTIYYTGRIEIHQRTDNSKYYIVDDTYNGVKYDSYDTIQAACNNMIQTEALDRNRFILPFMARIALRMTDGRHVSLSAPCMMTPGTAGPVVQPLCYNESDYQGETLPTKIIVSALAAELQLRLPSSQDLESWKDYITDVVVGITPPIYTYDASIDKKEDQRDNIWITRTLNTGFTISGLSIQDTTPLHADPLHPYAYNTEDYIYRQCIGGSRPDNYIHLPEIKDQEQNIEAANTFYIIKKIPIQDILDGKYNNLTTLDLTGISLDTLTSLPQINEDYTSLNQYQPETIHAYNTRLHIANYTERMFRGWDPSTMSGYNQADQERNMPAYTYSADIYFKENQNTHHCITPFQAPLFQDASNQPQYYFFPHLYAEKVDLWRYDAAGNKYYTRTLTLQPHPFMKGSYHFDHFQAQTWTQVTDAATITMLDQRRQAGANTPACTLQKDTYMKISAPGNPFYYTDDRTYTFDSTIIGIAAAVMPLSQGQKGQFDLYVFTRKDGIWTLKINDQGSYANQVPVSPDICTNPGSITPILAGVVYVTERGLMLLQGNQRQDLSQAVILNAADNAITTYPYDLSLILQDGQIIEDRINNRLIVFCADHITTWHLDLDTLTWTKGNETDIIYKVNSYPNALAVLYQDSGNILADLATPLQNYTSDDDISTHQIRLVTRSIDLDLPNEYKTIDTIRLNGQIQNTGNIHLEIWGSNNLNNWIQISYASTGIRLTGYSGNPYRFLRIHISGQITQRDTIDSITLAYRVKQENTNLFI